MRLHTCRTFCICQLQCCCCQRSSHFRSCSVAQHGARQFQAFCYRPSYASLVTPLPPSLHESGAAPTLTHQQPCAVVSLASTSLVWSDRSAPQLCLLQLLLPNCIRFSLLLPNCVRFSCYSRLRPLWLLFPDCVLFSCCSSSASACYHTHSTKYIKYEGRTSLL